MTNDQIDTLIDQHYRLKNHPDSYAALRATIRDALGQQAAELAELKDAARINLENYEFQRNKADKATAGLYSVHYALKDVGWHPGRTDDLLSDIIKARGAEAKADAARLDYLQQKQATISLVPDGSDDQGTRFAFMVGGWHCSVNRDARASIDAAIAASAA